MPQKPDGYYSSGQFARLAKVSVRTIRFYDQQNLLSPSYVSPSGARFYTDADLVKLQQILLLKYLGFSLGDIREMTMPEGGRETLLRSLDMQKKLVEDRIEQLHLMQSAIEDTRSMVDSDAPINWSQMLELIHLTSMEESLASQYKNASNLSSRIRLHRLYAKNEQGWFPWVYSQLPIPAGAKRPFRILEVGCGSGALWAENLPLLPEKIQIVLTDISDGMIRDARKALPASDPRFSFRIADMHDLPFSSECFDLVIANHVLFYSEALSRCLSEIFRVLKPNGLFAASTYGKAHMQEITALVQRFDPNIVLSRDHLYERFGLENGASLLSSCFASPVLCRYVDSLFVTDPDPLIDYILSCHGNQSRLLLDRYREFHAFVEERTRGGFSVTKDAGLFLCKKVNI